MAKVTINYDLLYEARQKVYSNTYALSLYDNIINNTIISKLKDYLDNDDEGHIQNILDNAMQKSRNLRNNEEMLDDLYKKIKEFVEYARNADANVVVDMKNITASITGNLNPIEAVVYGLYNLYFVDIMNAIPPAKFIGEWAKNQWTEKRIDIKTQIDNTYEYFKYGEGQYLLNIGIAAVEAIAAIGCAVAAFASIPFTGGATIPIVIGYVAATAATVTATITYINSVVKIRNNQKALYDIEDPSVARYFGSIEGYSDAIEKTDMGDAATNRMYKKSGDVFDAVGTTAAVVGVTAGIASMGNVKSAGTVVDYKFNKKNIVNNIKDSMGYDLSQGKWNPKKMFTPDLGQDKLNGLGNPNNANFNISKTVRKKLYSWDILDMRAEIKFQRDLYRINRPTAEILKSSIITNSLRSKGESFANLIDKEENKSIYEGAVVPAINYDVTKDTINLISTIPAFSPYDKVMI